MMTKVYELGRKTVAVIIMLQIGYIMIIQNKTYNDSFKAIIIGTKLGLAAYKASFTITDNFSM